MTHPKSKPYNPNRYSGDKNETARNDSLPTWGAAYLLDGEYFKIGHLGKAYRWGITEWMTTSRTVEQIKKGVFGRFWGGRFRPEGERASVGEKVSRMQSYWNSYNKQEGFEAYSDGTFLNDALYGIAISINADFEGASGFDRFKKHLAEFLEPEVKA